MSDKKKILYVEDDEDIHIIARLALCDVGGFEIFPFTSGFDAIDVAAEIAPDVILLDVMMPGLDGPGTLAGLRQIESLANTPVIFLTAKVNAAETQEYLALGAMGVISKPFNPMALADEVRRIVGFN